MRYEDFLKVRNRYWLNPFLADIHQSFLRAALCKHQPQRRRSLLNLRLYDVLPPRGAVSARLQEAHRVPGANQNERFSAVCIQRGEAERALARPVDGVLRLLIHRRSDNWSR